MRPIRLEWLVGRRYLRSPHRPAVLRLVTILSVAGVAAGVATLVIALAMDTGFRETIQDRLLGATAEVSLVRPGSEGIRDYDALAARLASLPLAPGSRGGPEIRAVTPAAYQSVLLSFAGAARGVLAKGIDPQRETQFNAALKHIVAGRLDFLPDRYGIESVVVGRLLAEELKISPGDYVTLLSPEGRLTPYGLIPRTRRFRVSGVFDSGFYDYDENWCFTTLGAAQQLAGTGDVVNMLEFWLVDPDRAGEVAHAVTQAAGPGFSATTWMDENRALFRAMHLEKLVTAIFIGLITFVAGLNILVVLSMTVTDKARDIAVLMSMGARREQVRRIFLGQGIVLGAAGTLIGLAAGYSVAWIAGTYRLIPLDPQVYAVSYVPFHPSAMDGVWIATVAMFIAVAATLLPARSAARIFPVDILRYE
jgi:lipoprotein-releasing system permease protein